jgi:hypothetical protein
MGDGALDGIFDTKLAKSRRGDALVGGLRRRGSGYYDVGELALDVGSMLVLE